MLDPLTHQYIQVIGGEVISEFPKFPGLQKYPHSGVCVLVFLYLNWSY